MPARAALHRSLPSAVGATLLLLVAFLLSAPSASCFPTYPLPPVHSSCTWFASRTCTSVVWAVPRRTVNESIYDKLIAGDILAKTHYTGSRICKRWYADWKCRAAFPACSAEGMAQLPCLAECRALAERCPSFGLQCDTKLYVDDKRQCMPREKLINTPFTPGMVMP